MEAASDAGGRLRGAGIDRLLACYRGRPGAYDEMLDAQGGIRPHWRALIQGLAALGDQAPARFAAADRYLRDSGVFYRAYDGPGPGERPWPLAHVPIVISAEDWAAIRAGALQRAQLLEAVLADAYGPGRLTERGLLPAAVIAGSPEFLRPLAGSMPPGGRHLGFYAIDLARAPDGRWWVVADRTQAPSGAGYALENRGALARALSDLHPALGIRRLGRFFDRFRDWLDAARADDDAGPCLLTPGGLNETYFEHAWLARQLGLRLVEGQDLTVRDHRLYLRTIAGLKPVGALWRRVDADFCDPLELNRNSRLGVPGLVQAVRHGQVVVANALGSGLAETPALPAFLPALAEAVTGQALLLPNVATWWCGQDDAMRFVLGEIDGPGNDKLSVAPAFGRRGDGPLAHGPVRLAKLDAAARTALRDAIAARGMDFIGQEMVTPATTPVWVDGRLEPRPFLLRVFVAATAGGWSVMPGGFALVGTGAGDQGDARAISIQRGARSADVWVLGDGHAESGLEPAAVPTVRTVAIRRTDGALPSRAADNLFWLARYLARAEATLRVVRALALRLTERQSGDAGLAAMLAAWGAAPPHLAPSAAAAQALFAIGQGTVPDLVQAARAAASVVRDRLPDDALSALDALDACLRPPAAMTIPAVTDGVVLDVAGRALRLIAAVNGFQVEIMNRRAGWHFLQLGHQIERAIAICRFVRQFGGKMGQDAAAPEPADPRQADPEALEVLLELAESWETYRSRYVPGPVRLPVLDLVLMDETNPRALAYAVSRIVGYAASLPAPGPEPGSSPVLAAAHRLADEARAIDPATVGADRLVGIENRLMQLSNAVSHSYFTLREPAAGNAAP